MRLLLRARLLELERLRLRLRLRRSPSFSVSSLLEPFIRFILAEAETFFFIRFDLLSFLEITQQQNMKRQNKTAANAPIKTKG
jgi:hypothetical protein